MVHVLLPSERLKLQLQEMEDADNMESALPAEESANLEGDEGASKAKEVAKKESLKEPEELAPEEKGPDFSKSTFAALQFFKERGMLNEEKRRVYAGRGNDEKYLKRDERMENQDNSDGIRLDRVNKEGVALTKKQAFREMCWSFHNKQPKKLKRQKMSDRIKQLRAVRSKPNLRQEPKIQPEAWFHEL